MGIRSSILKPCPQSCRPCIRISLMQPAATLIAPLISFAGPAMRSLFALRGLWYRRPCHGDRSRLRIFRRSIALAILQPAKQNQDKHDNEDEAEPAPAIVAGPVEGAASDSAEAPEQRDYQYDEEDGSKRNSIIFLVELQASCRRRRVSSAARMNRFAPPVSVGAACLTAPEGERGLSCSSTHPWISKLN